MITSPESLRRAREQLFDSPLFQKWAQTERIPKPVDPQRKLQVLRDELFRPELIESNREEIDQEFYHTFLDVVGGRLSRVELAASGLTSTKARLVKTGGSLEFHHAGPLAGLIVHEVPPGIMERWLLVYSPLGRPLDRLLGIKGETITIPVGSILQSETGCQYIRQITRNEHLNYRVKSRYHGLPIHSIGVTKSQEGPPLATPASPAEYARLAEITVRNVRHISEQFIQVGLDHGHLHSGNLVNEYIKKGYLKKMFRRNYTERGAKLKTH